MGPTISATLFMALVVGAGCGANGARGDDGIGGEGSGGAGGGGGVLGSGGGGTWGLGGGSGSSPPSCVGLSATCSATGDVDCCASGLVVGGTFQRDNITDPAYAATIDSFQLDTYEVTVGRFQRFVAGYPDNLPAPGSGRNSANPDDRGWDARWISYVRPDQDSLINAVQCDPAYQTWGGDDNRAMNCVTWFEAYAFCIWDGGRLPTRAEWNYAAAGGGDQRYYPWSDPFTSETIDPSYAVYSPAPAVAQVGSKSPKGDGRFGQADLAGNLWEWVQDWYTPTYTSACHNCANLMPAAERVLRGGSFYDDHSYLSTTIDDVYDPTARLKYIGFRCARNL